MIEAETGVEALCCVARKGTVQAYVTLPSPNALYECGARAYRR